MTPFRSFELALLVLDPQQHVVLKHAQVFGLADCRRDGLERVVLRFAQPSEFQVQVGLGVEP